MDTYTSVGDDQGKSDGCKDETQGHVTETEQAVGTVLGFLFRSPAAEGKKLLSNISFLCQQHL